MFWIHPSDQSVLRFSLLFFTFLLWIPCPFFDRTTRHKRKGRRSKEAATRAAWWDCEQKKKAQEKKDGAWWKAAAGKGKAVLG
jgi:hypothetical protein